jgi:hypothetical protein
MRPIRRHPFTAIETSIFLGSASLMLAPRFEVRLGAPGEEPGPRALEGQTRLMKRCGGPVAGLARPAASVPNVHLITPMARNLRVAAQLDLGVPALATRFATASELIFAIFGGVTRRCHVCFAHKATEVVRRRNMSRRARSCREQSQQNCSLFDHLVGAGK